MNDIVNWLLSSDQSVRYQTMKYILSDKGKILESERQKMLSKGWVKHLLDLQDTDGTWGKGIYSPKWISTTYTLLLLKRLEAPATENIRKACLILEDKGRCADEGVNFSSSMNRSETCITGMVLSILSFFGIKNADTDGYVRHLLKQQMHDGGWNCQSYRGAVHSSFHTTINVLEGLYEYENLNPDRKLLKARKSAEEFLLKHRLFKSHTTGEVFDNRMTMLSFPPRWRYDIMRILDYFALSSADRDERMEDAVQILYSKKKDGRWPLQQKHPGRVFFDLEKAGKPSAMNTMRALRMLKWWEAG